ncbi:class I adenylate-forming enzyme family protein [Haloarchaeobius salinus]|uniref:class I adenylate-forming enzyme family protein n=1 Tax=Haloarchaeobius salinus TaxID=1198298 RepID=UPI00210AE012|nr:AMP-binding protein [Haloarchaeobius salinus]
MRIETLLQRRIDKTPDATFLTFSDSEYTYREVGVRARRYASALSSYGIEADDRIGVFLPNGPSFLFTFFGACYLDAVVAPSNPEYTVRELEHSINLSNPRVLVTTSGLLDVVESAASDSSVERILVVDDESEHDSLPAQASSCEPIKFDPDSGASSSVAVHVYTSGTTGPPKAVEGTHNGWTTSAIDFQKRMGLTHKDTLLTSLPLFHANAQVYTTLGAAAAGAEAVIREKFSTSRWWKWCREHGATEFNAMGSMLKMLDNLPEAEDDTNNPVELVFSAGTPPELIEPFEERFDLRVVEGYSLSEDPLLTLNPTDPAKRRVGSVGLPPAEKAIRVVDEDGNEQSIGEKGEIIMRSPGLMNGYHSQPERTAEAIRDGWLYTGDYGRVDEDGFVYFLDRKKDIVRRGGENISSHEVEGVIKSLDGVDEVAIIPTPDEFYGEVVKALVRKTPDADLAPADVVAAVEGELSSFKVPEYVEFVEEFPYTPTGKIQKEKLREREQTNEVSHWERPFDTS